jgi:hypothetical protein
MKAGEKAAVADQRPSKQQRRRNRNTLIVSQAISGKRPSDIARRFDVTPCRVRQIVAKEGLLEQRRSELKREFGVQPRIDALPDGIPIDVLILCDANIHGWGARILRLASSSLRVKTLGDLRDTTDDELLREPGIGRGLVAELRRFCAFRGVARPAASR